MDKLQYTKDKARNELLGGVVLNSLDEQREDIQTWIDMYTVEEK